MRDWQQAPIFGERPAAVPVVIRPCAYGLVENDRGELAIVRVGPNVYLAGQRRSTPLDAHTHAGGFQLVLVDEATQSGEHPASARRSLFTRGEAMREETEADTILAEPSDPWDGFRQPLTSTPILVGEYHAGAFPGGCPTGASSIRFFAVEFEGEFELEALRGIGRWAMGQVVNNNKTHRKERDIRHGLGEGKSVMLGYTDGFFIGWHACALDSAQNRLYLTDVYGQQQTLALDQWYRSNWSCAGNYKVKRRALDVGSLAWYFYDPS